MVARKKTWQSSRKLESADYYASLEHIAQAKEVGFGLGECRLLAEAVEEVGAVKLCATIVPVGGV